MDLITADPSSVPPTASATPPLPTALGKPKTKRGTLMQIQSDTISVAKALNPVKTNIMPQRQKKKVPHSHPPVVALYGYSVMLLY